MAYSAPRLNSTAARSCASVGSGTGAGSANEYDGGNGGKYGNVWPIWRGCVWGQPGELWRQRLGVNGWTHVWRQLAEQVAQRRVVAGRGGSVPRGAARVRRQRSTARAAERDQYSRTADGPDELADPLAVHLDAGALDGGLPQPAQALNVVPERLNRDLAKVVANITRERARQVGPERRRSLERDGRVLVLLRRGSRGRVGKEQLDRGSADGLATRTQGHRQGA